MKLFTEIIALCDYATISKENKLSINGIFDIVNVSNFPGGIPRGFLVATISGQPNTTYSLTLKATGPAPTFNPLTLDSTTSANGKSNLIVELVNLVFQKPGEYNFELYNKKERVGSTLLKVLHSGQNEQRTFKSN